MQRQSRPSQKKFNDFSSLYFTFLIVSPIVHYYKKSITKTYRQKIFMFQVENRYRNTNHYNKRYQPREEKNWLPLHILILIDCNKDHNINSLSSD